jgi:phosphoglycolate phosphatase-like HAD superfamily hydrolase
MTLTPKLVIFDMDGTLIRVQHRFFIDAANRIFDEMSLPARNQELMEQFISEHRLFDILEDNNTATTRAEFWSIYNRTVVAPPAQVIDGASEAIDFCLSNGSKVALATARPWPESRVRAHLEDTALLNKMSVVSTWHGTDWVDKQTQLLEVCQRLEIDPALSAKVGDLPSDVSSAYAAGLGLAVSVLSGNIDPSILKNVAKPRPVNTKHIIINDVSNLGEHLFPSLSTLKL